MSLREEKKNNFIHEAVLEISIKKQLTTTHEADVSCTKQTQTTFFIGKK